MMILSSFEVACSNAAKNGHLECLKYSALKAGVHGMITKMLIILTRLVLMPPKMATSSV